jgi:hypothetical protein
VGENHIHKQAKETKSPRPSTLPTIPYPVWEGSILWKERERREREKTTQRRKKK